MNKHMFRIALISAALAVCAVSVTGAKEQAMNKGKGVAKSVPFSVTGQFSGSLSGEIVVNGQSIFINDKTSIHKVGHGPIDQGSGVSNCAVLVGGVMKGKKAIATMILVGEPESREDFSQTTIPGAERDPAATKGR